MVRSDQIRRGRTSHGEHRHRDEPGASWLARPFLADPPVGPTLDDLATALADLAPFRVTSPPTDVTIYGYRGKHLELTVPNLHVDGEGNFVGCVDEDLMGWVAPLNGGPYYGYTGPDYTEEFWILDVEGSRLVVSTQRTPDMPAQDIAESRAILDSIRIEP